MKTQEGKYYYNRMMAIIGPVKKSKDANYPFTCGTFDYTASGRVVSGDKCMGDLVAEWKPGASFLYVLWVRLLIMFNA